MLSVFFKVIALVFGVAWICEAWAQTSLPPCASTNGVWNRCVGTKIWPDGKKYIGEWKDGTQNGKGTMTWSAGKYVGEFRDGGFNGHGRQSYQRCQAYG